MEALAKSPVCQFQRSRVGSSDALLRPVRTLSSAACGALAASCSIEPSAGRRGALKAKSSIQETARVKLKPVQGTPVWSVALKEVVEGVFKAG